jgi:hypothetical protein
MLLGTVVSGLGFGAVFSAVSPLQLGFEEPKNLVADAVKMSFASHQVDLRHLRQSSLPERMKSEDIAR